MRQSPYRAYHEVLAAYLDDCALGKVPAQSNTRLSLGIWQRPTRMCPIPRSSVTWLLCAGQNQSFGASDILGIHALLLRLPDIVCLRWLDAPFQRTLWSDHYVNSASPSGHHCTATYRQPDIIRVAEGLNLSRSRRDTVSTSEARKDHSKQGSSCCAMACCALLFICM